MNQTEKIRKYYKFHSKIYDATRWLFLFNRPKAIRLLQINPGEHVVDFACGTGLNLPYIAKKTTRISALDFSEDMLAVARYKNPGINFIEGDACTESLPEKADKIICTYSLSLIGNWKGAIENMQRNLNPSGSMVILDFHTWQGLIKPFYPIFNWWLKFHGVNSGLNVEQELKKYFRLVEIKTNLSGYNFIAVAKNKFIQ